MSLLPGLPNFLKSHKIYELQPCKFDIYKLKKIEKNIGLKTKEIKLILCYKIKKTKYYIHSCKATFRKDSIKGKITGSPIFEDGYVVVKKGFKSRKFKHSMLPSGVTNSIAKHMDRYNQLYKDYAKEELHKLEKRKDKKVITDKAKREKFLQDLDL